MIANQQRALSKQDRHLGKNSWLNVTQDTLSISKALIPHGYIGSRSRQRACTTAVNNSNVSSDTTLCFAPSASPMDVVAVSPDLTFRSHLYAPSRLKAIQHIQYASVLQRSGHESQRAQELTALSLGPFKSKPHTKSTLIRTKATARQACSRKR